MLRPRTLPIGYPTVPAYIGRTAAHRRPVAARIQPSAPDRGLLQRSTALLCRERAQLSSNPLGTPGPPLLFGGVRPHRFTAPPCSRKAGRTSTKCLRGRKISPGLAEALPAIPQNHPAFPNLQGTGRRFGPALSAHALYWAMRPHTGTRVFT
jgi:hypothetical protein